MIGLIANARARRLARDPELMARLTELVRPDGRAFLVRSHAELRAAIDALGRDGCRLLVSAGGDGAHGLTLGALRATWDARPWPDVALLPAGTVNTVARNLGLTGRPDVALARLLRGWRDGGAWLVERDLIEVNGRLGFLCAAAMGARFMAAYDAQARWGAAWAAWLALRVTTSALAGGTYAAALFRPARARLVVDGLALPLDALTLFVASVVPEVGLGLRVPWRAGAESGRFHLVASGLPPRALALQLPRVWRGQPLGGTPHFDAQVERVELDFAAEEPYVLDGDRLAARRLDLRVGPRVRLLSRVTREVRPG